MSNIFRYSGNKVHSRENLAEHSYYVTVLADLFTKDIQNRFPDKEIDNLKVLKFALYHDYEEVFTGDLVTPVKYKSDTLRLELERIGKQMLEEGLQEDYGEDYKHLKSNIEKYFGDYEKYKYIKLENQIVKFSDQFEIVLYSISEINSGNLNFISILETVVNSIIKRWGRTKYFNIYVKELIQIINNNNFTKQKFEEIELNL